MNRSAHVTSIDVVRDFAAAMVEFQDEVRGILTQLSLEQRRAQQWFEEDRPRYWPEQVRRASDAMIVARNELERCQMAVRPADRPSCLQQKKALEKAQRRLRLTEQKVEAAKKWARTIRDELDDLTSHASVLGDYVDTRIPLAIAELKRLADALDGYVESSVPDKGEAPTDPSEDPSE